MIKTTEMSKEQAVREIERSVYEATALFERLEAKGRVRGNGHHIRQKIAKVATDFMEERWISK